MKRLTLVVVACLALGSPLPEAAQQYSARHIGDVVQLEDAKHQITVSVVPAVGNVAFEMKVRGVDVLHFPYASVEEFRKQPRLSGIPFLAPWANRLDEQAFYANGLQYKLNMTLGNVRGERPIHGFVSSTPHWRVVETRADDRRAWVTSRLEFYRQPAWMAQFPFAHTVDMTYRLQDGVLEVATRIENVSTEPMPVAVGFHPYFRVTDAPRDDWTVSVGARTEWVLSSDKIPTGETRPIERLFPNPKEIALRDFDLDHVFGDLIRDAGRAVMSVKGRSQAVNVIFGPNYRAAVIYAPRNRNFICFEPMAGITNALNLAHRGVYKELQSIAPAGTWEESFWVQPSGF